MNIVEKISIKEGYEKMAVISGIGVRNYYKKLGYKLENTFMIKTLTNKLLLFIQIAIIFVSIMIIFLVIIEKI